MVKQELYIESEFVSYYQVIETEALVTMKDVHKQSLKAAPFCFLAIGIFIFPQLSHAFTSNNEIIPATWSEIVTYKTFVSRDGKHSKVISDRITTYTPLFSQDSGIRVYDFRPQHLRKKIIKTLQRNKTTTIECFPASFVRENYIYEPSHFQNAVTVIGEKLKQGVDATVGLLTYIAENYLTE
jgi:hypothetical protein